MVVVPSIKEQFLTNQDECCGEEAVEVIDDCCMAARRINTAAAATTELPLINEEWKKVASSYLNIKDKYPEVEDEELNEVLERQAAYRNGRELYSGLKRELQATQCL